MTAFCVWGPTITAPHPDALREALSVLEAHGGHAGPHPEETMHCLLAAVRAWEERHDAEERAHARRRDDPMRLHESEVIASLAEARRRTRARTALDDVR
jgi:hypothetical protein